MSELLAHLRLFGRHRATVWAGGYRWNYCAHRSHRLRLLCFRWQTYDGYCAKHNSVCYWNCDK